jgi:predicted transcriptional regulator
VQTGGGEFCRAASIRAGYFLNNALEQRGIDHVSRGNVMAETTAKETILTLAVQIVSAHVQHNKVLSEELPAFIEQIYKTLQSIGAEPAVADKPAPAVAVKKSVFDDQVICLDCGKKLKMLKRHLMTDHGMTPEQYRERWTLGRDYPMVAPDYASKRSALAKKIGLGRKSGAKAPAKAKAAKVPARKVGRPRKVAA